MEEVPEGRWLSLQDAAAELHVSLNTLRRRAKDGEVTARKVARKQGYRYEVLVAGASVAGEEVPAQVPTGAGGTSQVPTGQVPAEQMEALRDALQIVDRLTRENLELAGRVGFLQGQLESAKERVALLEAPKTAESAPQPSNPPQRPAPRPWWRFWQTTP
jgi:hypothetical protein